MKLKFRAYNIAEKAYYANVVGLRFDKEDGVIYLVTQTGEEFVSWEPDIIIEQWTGLFDKNGIEIYVGDLLKDEYGNIGPCYYEPSEFVFINTSGNIDDGSCWEVIGNIHKGVNNAQRIL